MRIAVFGTGGVGGYFGGRLAQAGEEVVFIARGRHLQAMRERGLRVESIKGDFLIEPVQATAEPAEVGPVEAVLVAVKAWQLAEAAEAIRPLVGPDTFVVPLLNGVEAPRQLSALYGQEKVLGGFCHVISFVAEPGHIRHVGVEPVVSFGELDNRRTERVERLYQAFKQAQGVTPNIPPDILVGMWEKFLLISPWSCVAALAQAPAGAWRIVPQTRRIWLQAMQEIVIVARAQGIDLTETAVRHTVDFVDKLPASMTASMQRDIQSSRPSELEAQCGAVVRLAEEVDAEAPTYQFLYGALLPREMHARGDLPFEA